jgi:hypothetical protein
MMALPTYSSVPFSKGEVDFRRSTDGGNSFGETINLSDGTGDSIRPEFTVSAPSWSMDS